jgi:hypothetical protein
MRRLGLSVNQVFVIQFICFLDAAGPASRVRFGRRPGEAAVP